MWYDLASVFFKLQNQGLFCVYGSNHVILCQILFGRLICLFSRSSKVLAFLFVNSYYQIKIVFPENRHASSFIIKINILLTNHSFFSGTLVDAFPSSLHDCINLIKKWSYHFHYISKVKIWNYWFVYWEPRKKNPWFSSCCS